MKNRLLASLAISALILSGCGLSEARDKALAEDAVKPLSLTNNWLPGLVAFPDYPAQGWGPAGYAGVSDGDNVDDPVQKFLATLGLQKTDFTTDVTLELITDGDTLDSPTLDFCGGTYPSDDLRVTRRQMNAMTTDGGWTGISSEVVQYLNADAAKQAISEIVARKEVCVDGFKYTTTDANDTTITFHAAPGPDTTVLVPAEDRAIMHFTLDWGSTQATSFVAYQIRGDTLIALYVTQDGLKTAMTQKELDSIYGLLTRLTNRLMSAEPEEVGIVS